MLKYVESAVTFSEFPDEIALCLNLSLCPNHCAGCSEEYLAGDIGEEVTYELIDKLVAAHPGITLIGFMGGDNDQLRVKVLAEYIHTRYNLKVGFYSGRDFLNLDLVSIVDYYKIGRWIMPQGPAADWCKTTCGPIQFPFSNQIMYKRIGNELVDITYKFRKEKISNFSRFIIN